MQPYFFIDLGKRYQKICYEDIIFVEACRSYVRFVTTRGSYMALLSMLQVESFLPANKFCRIHRSFIVSLDHVQSFAINKVFILDRNLPVGKVFIKTLQDKVLLVTSNYPKDCNAIPNVMEAVIVSKN